jgi:hypothetical protein
MNLLNINNSPASCLSFLYSPNIFLSTQFSNTLSPRSALNTILSSNVFPPFFGKFTENWEGGKTHRVFSSVHKIYLY